MPIYVSMPTATALPATGAYSDVTVRVHNHDGVPDTLQGETAAEQRVAVLSPWLVGTTTDAPAFSEQLITFNGNKDQWWDGGTDLHTTDTRDTMLFFSFIFPAEGVAGKIIQSNGLRVNINSTGEISVVIMNDGGSPNTLDSEANYAGGQFVAGTRTAIAVQTTADGTGTRVRSAFKTGTNPWDVGASNLDDSRARPSLDLTSMWGLFTQAVPGSYNSANWAAGLYGVTFYAEVTGNILTDSALLDAFVNADGTLKAPSELDTYLGATPAIDTRGNTVQQMNDLVNQGSLTIAGRGTAWS